MADEKSIADSNDANEDAKLAIIAGVGPGTGAAVARRFAQNYRVALLARSTEVVDALAEELPLASAFVCDMADADDFSQVLADISDSMGEASVVVHNGARGTFADVLKLDPDDLQANFQINTMSFLQLVQATAPAMIARREGAIVCTGNTAAYRGVANFAGFAPTKAAQRILAESMARRLGPEGVHVSYLAIDAVIDLPWTRQRYADKPDSFFCQPSDIADEVWHLAHQPRSAWTFDVKIRPFAETW